MAFAAGWKFRQLGAGLLTTAQLPPGKMQQKLTPHQGLSLRQMAPRLLQKTLKDWLPMSRLHKSQNIYWFPMSLNTPEGRGVPIRDTAKNGTFSFYVMDDTVRGCKGHRVAGFP